MVILFSIVQRKVLSPNDFDDIAVVVSGSPPSQPVATRPQSRSRKFTTTDLADIMDRLDQHRREGESPGRGDKRRAQGIEEMAFWWYHLIANRALLGLTPSAS